MTEEQTKSASPNATHIPSLLERIKEFDEINSEKIHNMEMDEHSDIFLFLSEKFYRPICIMIYLVLILAYHLYKKNNPLLIWKPIVHLGVVRLISPHLQSMIARPKPRWKQTINKRHSLTVVDQPFSMPCEEVMQSANLAIFLFCSSYNLAGLFIIPLLMIGKIYYSFYYLFDTIVSSVLGAAISFVLFLCLTRF